MSSEPKRCTVNATARSASACVQRQARRGKTESWQDDALASERLRLCRPPRALRRAAAPPWPTPLLRAGRQSRSARRVALRQAQSTRGAGCQRGERRRAPPLQRDMPRGDAPSWRVISRPMPLPPPVISATCGANQRSASHVCVFSRGASRTRLALEQVRPEGRLCGCHRAGAVMEWPRHHADVTSRFAQPSEPLCALPPRALLLAKALGL